VLAAVILPPVLVVIVIACLFGALILAVVLVPLKAFSVILNFLCGLADYPARLRKKLRPPWR
jgi:hypothetical protein